MNEKIYLAHHGIQGQKWGVRRYQNEDGTLTDAGKKRLGFGKKNQKEKDILKNWDNMSYQEQNKYLKEYKRKAEITKSISDTIQKKSDINKNTQPFVKRYLKTIIAATAGAALISYGKNFISNIGKIAGETVSNFVPDSVIEAGKMFTERR